MIPRVRDTINAATTITLSIAMLGLLVAHNLRNTIASTIRRNK